MENNLNDIFRLEISPRLKDDLRTAAVWGRLIATMGLCSCGLSLLVGLKSGSFILTLIMVAVYVVIYVFLLKFGNLVKKALDENDQEKLSEGLASLKTYFTILGVILIIVIAVLVLAFAFGVLGALVKF